MRAFSVVAGNAGHYVAYVQRGMLAGTGDTAGRGDAAEEPNALFRGGDLKGDPSPDSATPAAHNYIAHSTHSTHSAQSARHSSSGITDANAGPQALPWWRVSDTHVKRVTWSDVEACEAYLLLYVRCKGSAPPAP